MNLRRMIGVAAATLGVAAIGIGVTPVSVSAGQGPSIEDCRQANGDLYGCEYICWEDGYQPSSAEGLKSEARSHVQYDPCEQDDDPCLDGDSYELSTAIAVDNGDECEPEPCPFNPTISIEDPNCRLVIPTTTTTPPTTTEPPAPTTTVASEGPVPVVTDAPTTTAVASAGPVAVLPATGSSDVPLVIAGSMALLLGLGMVRFARNGAR
jgi:LPXTG-motif cell wall-anchored protein